MLLFPAEIFHLLCSILLKYLYKHFEANKERKPAIKTNNLFTVVVKEFGKVYCHMCYEHRLGVALILATYNINA